MAEKRPALERFLDKIDKNGDVINTELGACWNWLGHKWTSNGGNYGCFHPVHGKSVMAIRYAYEYFIGEIPKGLVPDHLCNNAECVNPYHVQIVTAKENILRGNGTGAKYARRTHCNNGHEYTPENTRITKAGARLCRICRRITSKEEKKRYSLKTK